MENSGNYATVKGVLIIVLLSLCASCAKFHRSAEVCTVEFKGEEYVYKTSGYDYSNPSGDERFPVREGSFDIVFANKKMISESGKTMEFYICLSYDEELLLGKEYHFPSDFVLHKPYNMMSLIVYENGIPLVGYEKLYIKGVIERILLSKDF